MKSLIIGYGEIGQSLYNILNKEYDCYGYDKKANDEKWLNNIAINKFDILHICFPYSKDFIKDVKKYQHLIKPKFTIIHSTVPVGTSKKLNAIHSPCIGIHPHLEKSMTTFAKFLGGKDVSLVADYFRRAGMKVYLVDKSESTELMKALCTSFYGLCLEYTKDVKRLCDKNDIPFELWTIWNNNYNEGYSKLDMREFLRPNLIPINKKIGGHCVIPNLDFIKSDFTELIKKRNLPKKPRKTWTE